ncbi:hypothetical protein HJFPF1_05090 [Paramyrothecium foliicola]|nr:hypothetical protein HJFPF1_05090 [Paramyrothecium foliicola]
MTSAWSLYKIPVIAGAPFSDTTAAGDLRIPKRCGSVSFRRCTTRPTEERATVGIEGAANPVPSMLDVVEVVTEKCCYTVCSWVIQQTLKNRASVSVGSTLILSEVYVSNRLMFRSPADKASWNQVLD